MADNKNIIIGLLVVVIILLAFLAFRSMMYSPVYNKMVISPGRWDQE